MKKITLFILILSILSVLILSCDQNEQNIELSELDKSAIDLLLYDYDDGYVPGAALLIVKNNEVLYAKEYGMANLEEGSPISSGTNFRLASVTKQFTAMCIMILKNRNQLDFENSLTDIFQNFPSYGNNITIRHLLNHASGLVDYEELIPDGATAQVKDRDVLNMMMNMDFTYFTPGTHYQYSNSGYALLAMIIEEVSGIGFADFLELNIFSPLEMSNAIAFEKGISSVTNRAYGYSLQGDEYAMDDQSLTSAVLGDGGIYTSLIDMFQWDQSLYTDQLVSFEMLNEAFTSGKLSNGVITGYGFGWRLDSHSNRSRVGHTGSTRGFRNVYHRYPKESLSIIILTNRNSGSPKIIANQIADIIFGS
ncbi:MAG TPA: class A beta-lactamase-related serine hydrolase [Candidatus Marinimicrobia bacterium]|nr:class A beta-lactamase-related serine hydrolase [Candidatus Neomarinimicrobiota bacterium]